MVDRRAAKALVAAAFAVGRHLSITEIAIEAHRLGFLPKDFNGPGGIEALCAIAMQAPAICSKRLLDEPAPWRGAVDRALDLISRH